MEILKKDSQAQGYAQRHLIKSKMDFSKIKYCNLGSTKLRLLMGSKVHADKTIALSHVSNPEKNHVLNVLYEGEPEDQHRKTCEILFKLLALLYANVACKKWIWEMD